MAIPDVNKCHYVISPIIISPSFLILSTRVMVIQDMYSHIGPSGSWKEIPFPLQG